MRPRRSSSALKSRREARVLLVGVVLQGAEGHAAEGAVVSDADDAEGAVASLVNGQAAAEALQRLVRASRGDAVRIFPPAPRASSRWWRRGRRRRKGRQDHYFANRGPAFPSPSSRRSRFVSAFRRGARGM